MSTPQHPRHTPLVTKLVLGVVLMFGFGFALVPLYDVFCDITGFGGKIDARPAQAMAAEVQDRWVTVEFIANLGQDAAWQFKPVTAKIRVRPGELNTVKYYAESLMDRPAVGQSSFNVTPPEAGGHFKKISCFCFTEQPFAAREGREMPVSFYLDPALPESVNTVTLSYTFYDVTKQQD